MEFLYDVENTVRLDTLGGLINGCAMDISVSGGNVATTSSGEIVDIIEVVLSNSSYDGYPTVTFAADSLESGTIVPDDPYYFDLLMSYKGETVTVPYQAEFPDRCLFRYRTLTTTCETDMSFDYTVKVYESFNFEISTSDG